jgi:hypothetical protein
MQWSYVKQYWYAGLPALICLFCATIDPPPPSPLSAPIIDSAEIVAVPDIDKEITESIHIQWVAGPDDSLSVYSFKIVRYTALQTLPLLTKLSIDSLNTLIDPVAQMNLPNRNDEQYIIYRIYALDSLDRPGDTSVACTVTLARSIPLLSPKDTFVVNQFKWEVPDGIYNQTRSRVILWYRGDPLWKSDDVLKYTNGLSEIFTKSLPDSLMPLAPGKYYWGIQLTIEGGAFPVSFTIRKLYVP